MNNPESTFGFAADPGFVPGSAKSLELLDSTVVEIARTGIPVLILGESGTGKDVYARLLHRLSGGSDAQLKKINCSILEPTQLLKQVQESSRAHFESHHPGTLLLDSIDELDPACQRALLSVLPDSQGLMKTANHFARIISSSARNLEQCVEAGQFRRELYFRINGVCLRLPPLRERKEDVGIFLDHFLRRYSRDMKKCAPLLGEETIALLMAYDWPGNIRQLENLAKEMVILGNPQLAVSGLHIKRPDRASVASLPKVSSLKAAARAASRQRERELILEALEKTKWNRKRAARDLQISYKALLYKLKQIGATEKGIQN
jgi:two-component system response regulator AtoC